MLELGKQTRAAPHRSLAPRARPRAVPGQQARGWGEEMLRAGGRQGQAQRFRANPSGSSLRSARYPRDPWIQPGSELLCPPTPGRAPSPLLGCPRRNPPGLPGSSTAGILLRGLCVTIFTVLSDSLLGRLVVSCSGITAFGSGEGRERSQTLIPPGWEQLVPPSKEKLSPKSQPATPSGVQGRGGSDGSCWEQPSKAELLQGSREAASPP